MVGAETLRISASSFAVGDVVVNEGDWISVDGTHGTVMLGQVPVTAGETPPEFETILGWADRVRAGHLGVRANADTGPDAANARRHGAEGIGLCRTEHMFLADDRLPIVRRMILAATPAEEEAALEALRVAQRSDFEEILEAMDALPVTVRLLDPPLHEFLPDTQELAIKEATVGLTDEESRLYEAAKAWHEFNPMLGTRGVRLGVIKPGLYAMQVRALMEAALDRVAVGGHPVVEIMIPLTVSREELALARSWVEAAIAEALAAAGDTGAGSGKMEVLIGTMIETPRAALRAGEIAEEADFFSFGTNDLTQMTFGFSRDDVEGRMMSTYLELGLLKRNPFEVVDPDGVGELVRLGVQRGRATTSRPQDRGLRRARRRSRVHRHLRRRRTGLRELLALPGAHRPSGRRPGRAGRPHRRRAGSQGHQGQDRTQGDEQGEDQGRGQGQGVGRTRDVPRDTPLTGGRPRSGPRWPRAGRRLRPSSTGGPAGGPGRPGAPAVTGR